MKPNQSNNGLILDINIHDVYQSGDINCLRRFLNTIETACKKTSLISSTINRKDQSGRTLLHKLAASTNESDSIEWLELLAQNHLLQLNIPDLESGWTPLHRALYHGNLRFAKVLMDQLECDLNTKDHEGEL
jgi:ankyrin repeat protein